LHTCAREAIPGETATLDRFPSNKAPIFTPENPGKIPA
jgi:hypothetical protein